MATPKRDLIIFAGNLRYCRYYANVSRAKTREPAVSAAGFLPQTPHLQTVNRILALADELRCDIRATTRSVFFVVVGKCFLLNAISSSTSARALREGYYYLFYILIIIAFSLD